MFVGPHLHVDCRVKNKDGLSDTHKMQDLLEHIARRTNMILAFPPIACEFPFAQSELECFVYELEKDGISSSTLDKMKKVLRRRYKEDSGITALSVWTTSHCSIHTWPDSNFFALDAFSCKRFDPNSIILAIKDFFEVDVMHINLIERFNDKVPKLIFSDSLIDPQLIPEDIVNCMQDVIIE